MTKYWPLLLIALLLCGAAVFAVCVYRRRHRRPLPPTQDLLYDHEISSFFVHQGPAWRAYLIAVRRNRLLEDLHDKLRRDYVKPGGLRSQCLDFLQRMEDESSLDDLDVIRQRLINTCLYPLHIAVMRYDDMLTQAQAMTFDPSREDILTHLGVHPISPDMPEPIRSATMERNCALLRKEPPSIAEAPFCELMDALHDVFDPVSLLSLIGGQYENLAVCRELLSQVQHDVEQLVAQHSTSRILKKEAE